MDKRPKTFEQKLSEMSDKELYDLLDIELTKLCKTYGKSFKMSIPPMVTDTDMLIGEILERFSERFLTKNLNNNEINKI